MNSAIAELSERALLQDAERNAALRSENARLKAELRDARELIADIRELVDTGKLVLGRLS